jgi:hypothetical protein
MELWQAGVYGMVEDGSFLAFGYNDESVFL